MDEEFSFYDSQNPDIVIKPAKGVAAYLSDLGYLVILQQGGDQDVEILINPEHIEQFALKVNDLAGR